MLNEVWKDIEDWPYQVSNYGNVRRTVIDNPFARNTYFGKILKVNTDRYGYKYVILCKDGKTKTKKIHSLVCEVFNGQRTNELNQVRHLNGDKQDNRPENLKWGSALDNSNDRKLHGHNLNGEKSPRSVISDLDRNKLIQTYLSLKENRLNNGFKRIRRDDYYFLAKAFNLKINTCRTIINKAMTELKLNN